MKNKILLTGIGILVVLLSLIAAHTPINWVYFSSASVVMAVLIFLQKNEIKKNLSGKGSEENSLAKFSEYLTASLNKIEFLTEIDDADKYQKNILELMEDTFPNIDDYRISIINIYGVAEYTNIAIPFAKAERVINRGVSASIDGYFNESKKNILSSLTFMKLAINEINRVIKNG